MSEKAVKKIDRKMLESTSKETLIDLVLELLNKVDELSEQNRLYLKRIQDLENEVRILKGEKKSQTFRTLPR